MVPLKLLLNTGLTLIFASTVTAECYKSNGFPSFNATLQNEILVPREYQLHFTVDFFQVVVEFIVTFDLQQKTKYIGVYTNEKWILQDHANLKSSSEFIMQNSNNTQHKSYKPLRQYITKNMLILEFPHYLTPRRYKLHLQYLSSTGEDKQFSRNQYFGTSNSSHLYRLLDSSNGFKTLSLTSENLLVPIYINILVNFPLNCQVFINTQTERHLSFTLNDKNVITSSLIPINQAMVMIGTYFESTKYMQTTFWHDSTIKYLINEAVYVTQRLWSQMRLHYIPDLPKYSKWLNNPPNSIVSLSNAYPTGSSLGLIVYKQADIIYHPEHHFSVRKAAVTLTATYEISRQVLSFLVHPSTWLAKCLQESLAVYLHYGILDDFKTQLNLFSDEAFISYLYVVQILQPSLHNDVVLCLKPVSTFDINAMNELDQTFVTRLYYNKVSALMRMLENTITSNMMKQIIYQYINQYAFKMASDANFWEIVATVDRDTELNSKMYNDIDYKRMMHPWLTQTHYPEVFVETNYLLDTLKIKVSLSRIHHGNYPCANYTCTNCTWPILLRFILFQNSTITHVNNWIELKAYNIHHTLFEGLYNFVILNSKQIGFYRVNYNKDNWMRIAHFLNYGYYKRIHVLNRAQLIDDSYYFVTNNKMNWFTFLHLVKYLKYEDSFIAWYPMINIMSYMSPFTHHPATKIVKTILLEIFEGLLENIKYEENSGDDDMKKSLRLLGTWWACKLGHTVCREKAENKLILHLKNPKANPFKPWWKNLIYCTGLMNGNKTAFGLMTSHLIKTRKTSLLSCLACNEDASNFMEFVEYLKRDKHMSTIFKKSKLKYYHLSHFVKQHAMNRVVVKYILDNLENIIPGVLSDGKLWADIIMNTHSREALRKVKKLAYHRHANDVKMFHVVQQLFEIQAQRITKLLSTNYYN